MKKNQIALVVWCFVCCLWIFSSADGKDIKSLVKDLGSEDINVRNMAVIDLGYIGAPAVYPVIEALKSGNSNSRIWAAKALGRIKDPRATEALIGALEDQERYVRWHAVEGLGEIGDPNAVEPLLNLLKDPTWNFGWVLPKALGQIGDTRAIVPLLEAQDLDHYEARKIHSFARQTVKAFKLMGNSAIDPLIKVLKEGASPHQMAIAAEALGKIKNKRAVPVLTELMNNSEADPFVRFKTADALAQIGDERALPPLIASLTDKNDIVQRASVKALGLLKDHRAVSPLIEAFKNDDFKAHREAAQVMGSFGNPIAVEPLIARLDDERLWVRLDIAKALGELRDPRAVDPLIKALDDKEPKMRAMSAYALGLIGDSRAGSFLASHLYDWHAKSEIAKALDNIGWQAKSDRDRILYYAAQKKSDELIKQWETTKTVLMAEISSGKYQRIENAIYIFMAIGKKEIIPDLVNKLHTQGDKTMAEAYLNCGQHNLENAAKQWALNHGYTVQTGRGAAPVGWGSWKK